MNPDPTPVPQAEITAALERSAETLSNTKDWTVTRSSEDVEIFTRPDGRQYARCQDDESADVIVTFIRIRGLQPLRLVLTERSYAVKSAVTRQRRKERELTKRGYDV